MRCAAEVPHEGGPFQPPQIPDLVVAEVVVLIKCQRALLEAALLFETLSRFFLIGEPVGVEDGVQNALDYIPLVRTQLGNRDSGEHAVFPAERDLRFVRGVFDKGLLLLLAIEHRVNGVGLHGQRPVDVPRMVGLFIETLSGMAVEDGATESDVVGRVAVAADRQMPAGHHKFELPFAGLSEEGDRLLLAVTTGVVLQLLLQPTVPFGVIEAVEDRLDHVPLVFGVEVAADVHRLGVGDVPVVRDVRPEEASLVGEVPGEADFRSLFTRQRFVELRDEILGRRLRGGFCGVSGRRENRDGCRGRCSGEELAAVDLADFNVFTTVRTRLARLHGDFPGKMIEAENPRRGQYARGAVECAICRVPRFG